MLNNISIEVSMDIYILYIFVCVCVCVCVVYIKILSFIHYFYIYSYFLNIIKAHPIQAFFIPKYANAIPMYFHLHFFLFRTKFVI